MTTPSGISDSAAIHSSRVGALAQPGGDMDNMQRGKTDSSGNRATSGMGPMWFCIGIGLLVLVSVFFWR
jgi:hypothetical protein